jgi:hypothetical protein
LAAFVPKFDMGGSVSVVLFSAYSERADVNVLDGEGRGYRS